MLYFVLLLLAQHALTLDCSPTEVEVNQFVTCSANITFVDNMIDLGIDYGEGNSTIRSLKSKSN